MTCDCGQKERDRSLVWFW